MFQGAPVSIQRSLIVRVGLALCGGLLALQAQAAAPTPEQLQHMPAPMRAEIFKRLMSQQAARRVASNPSGALDVTPPLLTAFNAGTEINSDKIDGQIFFDFSVSDDVAGLDYLWLDASSPSGRQVWATGTKFYGQKKFKGKLAMAARRYAEVGNYVVQGVGVVDVAGNYFFCDSACLAQMGNVQFTVTASVSDTQAPTLASGKILTTRLSTSKPAKGTENSAPNLSMQLNIIELGRSGIQDIGARFCRWVDRSGCISIDAGFYGLELGENATVVAGGELHDSQVGVYELETLWLTDRAGNTTNYKSIKFGGETDFSPFFPSTTITLVP
jgi:hypothetical protein